MPVSFERRDEIGIVTLSRPEARNAWGADFNEGIARHFAAMEDDDEIRCAVLTGDEAGGAFSAGANLKDPRTHTMKSAAEFIKSIADAATDGNTVRLAPVLIQPVAAEDVASAVGRIALGSPVNGIVEIAGPEQFRLDELIRRSLDTQNDPRQVIADPHARYFGAELKERTLIPSNGASRRRIPRLTRACGSCAYTRYI